MSLLFIAIVTIIVTVLLLLACCSCTGLQTQLLCFTLVSQQLRPIMSCEHHQASALLLTQSCSPVIVGTAHIVCRAVSMEWHSVCPSIHLFLPEWAHSSKASAAALQLWAWWAGDIDRLLQLQQMNAGRATLSAYLIAEHRLVISKSHIYLATTAHKLWQSLRSFMLAALHRMHTHTHTPV